MAADRLRDEWARSAFGGDRGSRAFDCRGARRAGQAGSHAPISTSPTILARVPASKAARCRLQPASGRIRPRAAVRSPHRHHALGDLDGDGVGDAVGILVEQPRGIRQLFLPVCPARRDGKPLQAGPPEWFGDRSVIERVTIDRKGYRGALSDAQGQRPGMLPDAPHRRSLPGRGRHPDRHHQIAAPDRSLHSADATC